MMAPVCGVPNDTDASQDSFSSAGDDNDQIRGRNTLKLEANALVEMMEGGGLAMEGLTVEGSNVKGLQVEGCAIDIPEGNYGNRFNGTCVSEDLSGTSRSMAFGATFRSELVRDLGATAQTMVFDATSRSELGLTSNNVALGDTINGAACAGSLIGAVINNAIVQAAEPQTIENATETAINDVVEVKRQEQSGGFALEDVLRVGSQTCSQSSKRAPQQGPLSRQAVSSRMFASSSKGFGATTATEGCESVLCDTMASGFNEAIGGCILAEVLDNAIDNAFGIPFNSRPTTASKARPASPDVENIGSTLKSSSKIGIFDLPQTPLMPLNQSSRGAQPNDLNLNRSQSGPTLKEKSEFVRRLQCGPASHASQSTGQLLDVTPAAPPQRNGRRPNGRRPVTSQHLPAVANSPRMSGALNAVSRREEARSRVAMVHSPRNGEQEKESRPGKCYPIPATPKFVSASPAQESPRSRVALTHSPPHKTEIVERPAVCYPEPQFSDSPARKSRRSRVAMVHSPPRQTVSASATTSVSQMDSEVDVRSRVAMVHSPPRNGKEDMESRPARSYPLPATPKVVSASPTRQSPRSRIALAHSPPRKTEPVERPAVCYPEPQFSDSPARKSRRSRVAMVHSPPRQIVCEPAVTSVSQVDSEVDVRSRVAMVHSPPRQANEEAHSTTAKAMNSSTATQSTHEGGSEPGGKNIEAQLLTAACGYQVREEAAVSIVEEFPELKWIASCIPLCPLPVGWISGENVHGRVQYINTETGVRTETPPSLDAFADLARLMIQWRGEPSLAGSIGASFDVVCASHKDDAAQARTMWTGPHVDPSSGVDYWHNNVQGRSCWGDPGMYSEFLSCVAGRLRQALPAEVPRGVHNRRGWLPNGINAAQSASACESENCGLAPRAPESGRSRRPGGTIGMRRASDRTENVTQCGSQSSLTPREAVAEVAALHQACGPAGRTSQASTSIHRDLSERQSRLKMSDGCASVGTIVSERVEEREYDFGMGNRVVREASAEIRADRFRNSSRNSLHSFRASSRDKLESLTTPRKEGQLEAVMPNGSSEQAMELQQRPTVSRPCSARRKKKNSSVGSPPKASLAQVSDPQASVPDGRTIEGPQPASPGVRPTSPSIGSIGDELSPRMRDSAPNGSLSPRQESPPNSPSILVVEEAWPSSTAAPQKHLSQQNLSQMPVSISEPLPQTKQSPKPSKKRGVRLGTPQPLSARGELRLMEDMLKKHASAADQKTRSPPPRGRMAKHSAAAGA